MKRVPIRNKTKYALAELRHVIATAYSVAYDSADPARRLDEAYWRLNHVHAYVSEDDNRYEIYRSRKKAGQVLAISLPRENANALLLARMITNHLLGPPPGLRATVTRLRALEKAVGDRPLSPRVKSEKRRRPSEKLKR